MSPENKYVRDGGGRIVNDLLSQQSVPQKRLIWLSVERSTTTTPVNLRYWVWVRWQHDLKLPRFFFHVAMDFASLVHVAVIWARHAGLDARMLSLIATATLKRVKLFEKYKEYLVFKFHLSLTKNFCFSFHFLFKLLFLLFKGLRGK